MDNDSKERPHKRPTNVISGNWRHDAQEQLKMQAQADARHTDELEALANIARSTIASLEHHDDPRASARLQDAAERLAAFGGSLRNAQNGATQSLGQLARRHPVLLTAGGLALGFALTRLLAKRSATPHSPQG